MPKPRTTLLSLALPVLVLGACASAPPAERSRARSDCINAREINAMDPLTDQYVFVRVGASRYYLFTMEGKCQGLELARRLGVSEAGTRVCGAGTSLLAFEHPTVGSMRCRIAQIDPVPDKDAAWERIRAEVPAEAEVLVPPE